MTLLDGPLLTRPFLTLNSGALVVRLPMGSSGVGASIVNCGAGGAGGGGGGAGSTTLKLATEE